MKRKKVASLCEFDFETKLIFVNLSVANSFKYCSTRFLNISRPLSEPRLRFSFRVVKSFLIYFPRLVHVHLSESSTFIYRTDLIRESGDNIIVQTWNAS